MGDFQNVLYETDGPVGTITLNRPDKLNPLDWGTVRELKALLGQIDADHSVRVVIVTGAGRAFSAGGDLEGYLTLYRRPDDLSRFLSDFYDVNRLIEESDKIFIASVNGVTVAGGLELMLACDVVIAAEEARIGDGHLNFAQLPGAGGSQRLPRTIGTLRAKRLMLTGELVSGTEAERIGLVTFAVPGDKLADETRRLAEAMLEKSPSALKGAKYLVHQAGQTDLEAGLALEIDFVHGYATTDTDAMEGLQAFKEKRKPKYKATR